jgi:hypothetical protein
MVKTRLMINTGAPFLSGGLFLTSFLHRISVEIQTWEVERGFYLSKSDTWKCRETAFSCCPGRQEESWALSGCGKDVTIFLDGLSCFLTLISFGTWQGRFSPEGNVLPSADKVRYQLWVYY